QRHFHATDNFAAVRIHLDAVIGVAGRSVPLDARVTDGAAGERPLLALQYEHPGAFTEYEAVPSAIEWTRCRARPIVVVGRHRAHPREPEDHARPDAAGGTARQQHIVFTRSHQRCGVADRIRPPRPAARPDLA